MTFTDVGLNVGDIISIPCDQYGRPVMAFDGSGTLQKFVVTGTDTPFVTRLVPASEPCPALRGVLYKAKP